MNTTAANITDDKIRELSTEAMMDGDSDQLGVCFRALRGDASERAECARVIANAEAMDDRDVGVRDRIGIDASGADVFEGDRIKIIRSGNTYTAMKDAGAPYFVGGMSNIGIDGFHRSEFHVIASKATITDHGLEIDGEDYNGAFTVTANGITTRHDTFEKAEYAMARSRMWGPKASLCIDDGRTVCGHGAELNFTDLRNG